MEAFLPQSGEAGSGLFDFRCFHLQVPRIDLYRRIDHRCEVMVRARARKEKKSSCCDGLNADLITRRR